MFSNYVSMLNVHYLNAAEVTRVTTASNPRQLSARPLEVCFSELRHEGTTINHHDLPPGGTSMLRSQLCVHSSPLSMTRRNNC